ncbi:LamG-like jellyroll fold domain-containing protein [Paenibacillus sp. H1-7]|uniref:LamG-like jellyroll fold domain-containing protein n=1 Tax=Paenibacillus sp. H1-7 TaxID=2282849 RepID=UPI001EF83A28|nr:LamG-like jellyroll fold domain-containing protein [Paenibacillus sp. H1-7]
MNINYSKNLSERIAGYRKKRGLTQEQLAQRLGITYQAVSKWENGQSCPDVILLPLLCDVFQVRMDELFGRSMQRDHLRKGLTAEYLFNGDACDSSGNGRHGTIMGAAPCTDRFGNADSAYFFDGKDDYILVQPAPDVSSEAFSLSVWCSYNADARFNGWGHCIVAQDGHHMRRVFQLSTFNTRFVFHRFMLEPDLRSGPSLHRELWYHLAVTYDNQVFKLYRNGVLVSERQGRLRPDTEEPLYIGRKATDEPYFFFHGKIDDLRMYSRALSAEEVNELYLEDGWQPVSEHETEDEEQENAPILERVEDIRMTVPQENLRAVMEWYTSHLGFKLHVRHYEDLYVLSLQTGPYLLLHGTNVDTGAGTGYAGLPSPVIFRTGRSMELIQSELTAAGARIREIRDGGFAQFMDFQDPFGYEWTVMREK